MHRILIISPDPESRRAIQLALELGGMETETAVDPSETTGIDFSAVLNDMVEDSDEQWEAARRAMKIGSKGSRPPVALILPHGRDPSRLPKGTEKAGLVVKKPYELLRLVELVKALSGGAKKTPGSRKKTDAGRGKGRGSRKATTPRMSSSARRKARRAS
ncbi:MAG TPA: hypothetical protein PLZ86_00240 [bacterium]|nr:hypothetical protein [bacterium]